jgi:GT2 family glycosyltransferase
LVQRRLVRILIQCIVVLYKKSPDQAQSLLSLLEICRRDPSIATKIGILVQDNSPESHLPVFGASWSAIEYHHAPSNPGLADAYNRALQVAKGNGAEWLLLLDQDTVVTHDFLLQLLAAIEGAISGPVCAFAPKLMMGEVVLSPNVVGKFAYRPVAAAFSGFSELPLVAFNSAACLKVQSLEKIGGFPVEYWLDYLDHIVFHRLHAAGEHIYVLDAKLQHSLALKNIESDVSMERYSNILAGEWRFIKETGAVGGPLAHRLRLLKRALIYAIKLKNRAYAARAFRAAIQ